MDKQDIKEFREALKIGEVNFSYRKKDGTVRHACGTLCVKLTPKDIPMDTYEITSIEWDASETDINEYELPKRCKVKIFSDTLEDKVESALSKALTEDYGFHQNSFRHSKLEKKQKKLAEGTVFYYDLEKEGYRSFNESQLIEFIKPSKKGS